MIFRPYMEEKYFALCIDEQAMNIYNYNFKIFPKHYLAYSIAYMMRL